MIGKISVSDASPVLAENGIGIVEFAREPGAEQQTTDAIGENTSGIEQEEGGLSSIGLGRD